MDYLNVGSTSNNFAMKQLSKGPWIAKVSILRTVVLDFMKTTFRCCVVSRKKANTG